MTPEEIILNTLGLKSALEKANVYPQVLEALEEAQMESSNDIPSDIEDEIQKVFNANISRVEEKKRIALLWLKDFKTPEDAVNTSLKEETEEDLYKCKCKQPNTIISGKFCKACSKFT